MEDEQILQIKKATFDSLNLVKQLNTLESLDEMLTDTLNRNLEHLKLMKATGYFTEEELQLINEVL